MRESTDYPFVTDSDSEAALAAALSGELDALGHLRGMFAFAVAYDAGGVQVVRDPLGVKPLYWGERDGATYFASELRAFDDDLSPLVAEFPPAHRWTAEGGLARIRELHVEGVELTDRDEAVTGIRETLIDCVKRRLMADVPVGVFLSGGLDSSLVAAVMAHVYDGSHGPLHSFAAGTAGSSDLAAARRVAEHLGLEHHEIIYTADDVIDVLPEVVRCIESYEPSLVRSAVPNYLLARETAKTVKVVLTGEGADELFAGYAHHRDFEDLDELRDALLDGISGLHNLNLQRADRSSMAHGLEARVPFLDRDLVNLAARIPIEWKVATEHGQEKALLREAFAGWLPDDLLWRPKEQFGDDKIETYEYSLGGNAKSEIVGTTGSVKAVRVKDGPVVGVHMIGRRVSELVGEAQLIVNWEAYPEDVSQLVHAHPTQHEALGETMMKLAGTPLHAI